MPFLSNAEMPYCPGCGHRGVTIALAKAIDALGYDPLDVVIVSDIGCCGLVDGLVNSHTVHGLHGRSPAFAFGVSAGLNNPGKKVIVIMGDGGVTIGLQHILECARRNVPIFVLVQNNFVYGMTGGQISGLSPQRIKDEKMPEEKGVPPFDICELVHRAGGSFAARVILRGDISGILQEAISTNGFSLVEVVQPCVAYGVTKIKEIEDLGYKEIRLVNTSPPFRIQKKEKSSLFDGVPRIAERFNSSLQGRMEVLIAGSAGGGVQVAAELFARGAMYCGLNATKKGDFPITVRTGYSTAEVILSRNKVNYTGISSPDVAIITAREGFANVEKRLAPETSIILDKDLEISGIKDAVIGNFREVAGARNATLCAIAFWVRQSGVIPLDALVESARTHRHAEELVTAILASEKVETLRRSL
jgi:pyruvate/2-oxoacid:ferredoxin oxidoreductase beta subunit